MADEDKKVCRLCGGEVTHGKLRAGNSEATLVVAGKPDEFLGVIPYSTAQVSAQICRECGYVELFARNTQDLLNVSGNR